MDDPTSFVDLASKVGVVGILLLLLWALLSGKLVVRWVYDDLDRRYQTLLKRTEEAIDGGRRSTTLAEQSTKLAEDLMAATVATIQRQLHEERDDGDRDRDRGERGGRDERDRGDRGERRGRLER